MPNIRTQRIFLLTLVLSCAVVSRGLGQSPFVGPPQPEEQKSSVRIEPILPPKTEEEARNLANKIKRDLETTKETIGNLKKKEVLSETDKALLAALEALEPTLAIYQTQLGEYQDILLQIHGLEDSTAATALADELQAIQKAIEEVRNDSGRRPEGATVQELQQAEADLETVNTKLAASARSQEERVLRRAELPARLDNLKSEVETAQAILNRVGAEIEEKKATQLAPDSYEAIAADSVVDKLKYDTGLFLLRMARLEQEEKRDALLSAQTEQRLPLLQQLVAEHEKRVERYKLLHTRTVIQKTKEELEQAKTQPEDTSPLQLAALDLKVRFGERKQEIEEMLRQLGVRERFTAADFDALKEDVAADVAEWSPYMQILERKSGDKIKGYFRRLAKLEKDREAERDRLLSLYDNALDDRVRVTDRIDQINDEELRAAWRNFQELEKAEGNSEIAIQYRTPTRELREDFDKGMAAIRTNLDALVNRLAEAGKLLSQHVDYLAAQRSRMYWSYLRVQDQPIWKYRWSETVAEWNTEAARRDAGILQVRKKADLIPTRTAVTVSIVLLAVLFLSWLMRNRLFSYADNLEQRVAAAMTDPEQTVAPVSDRFHLQFIRFLARTAPVVLPVSAAWIWIVGISPLDGRVARPVMVTLVVAGVASALISTLFSRSKPRFRLVPCSNVVAAHYRRFARVLLYVSILMLPLPVILHSFEGAPYSRNYVINAYKILALIIILIFALPRQTVLRVVGRPQEIRYQLVYLIVSTAYPILFMGVVALLILQVIGFGPLVTYVITGVSLSIVTIVLAVLLVRYSRDMILRLEQRIAAAREDVENQNTPEREHARALSAGREVTLMDRTADSFDQKLWMGLFLSIFRLGVGVAAFVVILGSWGVSRVDMQRAMDFVLIAQAENRPAITIGRALAAIGVLLLTWLFSRGIRAFLDARVYPAYTSLDRGGRVAISTLLHYTLVFLGLYFCLYIMQIPLGALTVVLGTLGLGLGLGLQPVFINFLSGIIILFERHVKVGDLIEVNGVLGEVSGISLRATTIKTYDNVDMVIPNADFVSGSVVNWTMNDPRIRGKIEVGVDYDSDVRVVERLLLQAAKESKLVLKEPPPRVRFTQFGDSALNFVLYAWFYNAADRFEFMTDGRYRILELFRENNINIPFPEQTLNLSGDTALRVQVEHVTPRGEKPSPSMSGERPIARS